jgi:ElaB/YqjD/DUF883 family membrane-anchored ribosome-binding protein
MSISNDQRTNSPYTPASSSASQGYGSSASSTPADSTTLRADLDSLKQQFSDFVSKAGADAMNTAKQTTNDVANQVQSKAADMANQVGSKASDLANAASEQAKTFASELERFGRGNPLGAIAGALLVGVVIGLIGRRH